MLAAQARALLATLDDERANSGEIHHARAVICLAEGDPAGALGAAQHVLDGTAPAIGCGAVVEAHLLASIRLVHDPDKWPPRRRGPACFSELVSHRYGSHAVLTGPADRSALDGVLAEIEALHLDLRPCHSGPQITGFI
jgi:hypothetical protein